MAIKDPRRFQNKTDPSLRKNTGNKDAIPEIWSSIGQKASKVATDGIRGAFLNPEATAPFTQSVTGSGVVAGQTPEPTMYGVAHQKNSLDPRHVLPDSILGSMANLFEVSFVGFPFTTIGTSLFRDRELGLLCSEASLPATSFGTLEVNGHYQGRTEVFAHTRIYPSLTLTFYETLDHKSLMFFESWQEYITKEEDDYNQSHPAHYYRMRFPEEYKCDTIFITKFEKNYRGFGYADTLTYQFIQAFPKNVTSVPVAYGQSEFTKVTVEFAYDRYIVNPRKAKAETKPGYISGAQSQELVREEPPIQPPTKAVPADSIEEPTVYDVNPTPTPGITPTTLDPDLLDPFDPEKAARDSAALAAQLQRDTDAREAAGGLPRVPGASDARFAAKVRAENNPNNLPGRYVLVGQKELDEVNDYHARHNIPGGQRAVASKRIEDRSEAVAYYKFIADTEPPTEKKAAGGPPPR